MDSLIAAVVAAVVSWAWCWVAATYGTRWGFVDAPDGALKTHQVVAVPLGGVGILAGMQVGILITAGPALPFVVGTLILVAVGLVDDRLGLSPWPRLLLVAAAGWALGVGYAGWWLLLIVAVVVVGANAINLFDGLDGLAGGTSTISFIGLAFLASARGQEDWMIGLLAAAALTGFLFWNRPPARVFLGDNGAYLLGGCLAYLAVGVSSTATEAVVALALIGVPLADLGITVLRRLRARVPLFAGDRDHSYDRLRARGWPVGGISGLFAGLQTLWVGLVLLFEYSRVTG